MSKIALSAPVAGVGTATIKGPETASDIEFQLPPMAGRIHVGGDIKLLNPMNSVPFNTASSGGQVSGSFVLDRASTCLISATASMYVPAVGLYSMTLSIDGIGNLSLARHFFNQTSVHTTMPPAVALVSLSAGTYTVRMTAQSNTDVNDMCTCTVIAIAN